MGREFSSKLTGRFVDDDDLIRTGRAWVEIDGFDFLHIPVPTGFDKTMRAFESQAAQVAKDAEASGKYASAAKSSASAAAASAGKVAESEGRVSADAKKAQDGATRAETAAGSAASSASSASSSASKAATSEQNAAGSASSAKQEADRAENIASSVDWFKGRLSSAYNLDDYRGSEHRGTYTLSSSTGGHPLNTPGWLTVDYDAYSGRTRQQVTASSPTDEREVYRTYSSGKWSDWRPYMPVGNTLTSDSNADDLSYPGYYPVGNNQAAGIPDPVIGGLHVIPAGTTNNNSVQLFVSSEEVPRMWMRRVGGEWAQIGGAEIEPEQEPISWEPDSETERVSSEIAGALSHDRMVTFNGVGGPLRQSRDQGRTWEIVTTFPGQSIELVEPLANGEVLVATSGTVDGVSSTRRVYVSDGYDPTNPSAATWSHKLTGSAQYVKFVDWSVSQHGPIVLLAEYGPKGGMVWGSGTEPIPEGENARHAHLSLDHGKTWKKIFDLNEFLISRGQTTLLHHIHGVAWDPYWDRIWLSFGDAMGGNGSNGVIYSDDLGATWEVAYHSAEVDTPEGWQVVGIQPMKDCILFAGDMTPSGVMKLDRAGGKHRETWDFVEAWNYGSEHKMLCHAIRYHETGRTETALFGFSREGTASPSIIVGTHDGIQWNLIWESSDNASPGFRFMAGPTITGELVAAINRNGKWTEIRGSIDAY